MQSTIAPDLYLNTENKPRRRAFTLRGCRTCCAKSKWIYVLICSLAVLFIIGFGYSLWLQNYIRHNNMRSAMSYTNKIGLYIRDDILLYEITKLHRSILRSWYLSGVEILMISKTAFDAVYNEIGPNSTMEMLDFSKNLNISIDLYVDDWCMVKINHPWWRNISRIHPRHHQHTNNSQSLLQPFILDTNDYVYLDKYKNSFDKYFNYNITKFTFESIEQPIDNQYENNQTLNKCDSQSIERIKQYISVYDDKKIMFLPSFNIANGTINFTNHLHSKLHSYTEFFVNVLEINSTIAQTTALFESYWKSLSNLTLTNKKDKNFIPPPQLSTKIDNQQNTTNYDNQIIMAMFTPGNLILNAGDEVIVTPTNNLTGYIEMIADEIDENSPIHQLVLVKRAFSNEYYKQHGFQMTKLILNDDLVMFLRKVSEKSRLFLLVNTKGVTISDVDVHQLVGDQYDIEEILLSHTSNINYSNPAAHINGTLEIGAFESVLLLVTLIQQD